MIYLYFNIYKFITYFLNIKFKSTGVYYSHFNIIHLCFNIFFILILNTFFNKVYCAEIAIVDVEIVTVYPNGECTIYSANTQKTTYSTIWAEMNNQVEDGNLTCDDSTSTESSGNNEVLFADTLLKDYRDTILLICNTPEDIVKNSLAYVKTIIPAELFAADEEAIRDEQSSIYIYLDNIKTSATLETDMDAITLANYVAAVTTYNVACVYQMSYETHSAILEEVYFSSITKIMSTFTDDEN